MDTQPQVCTRSDPTVLLHFHRHDAVSTHQVCSHRRRAPGVYGSSACGGISWGHWHCYHESDGDTQDTNADVVDQNIDAKYCTTSVRMCFSTDGVVMATRCVSSLVLIECCWFGPWWIFSVDDCANRMSFFLWFSLSI